MSNEPAFPIQTMSDNLMSGERVTYHSDQGGLTKREYFAAKALQGLLANPCGPIQRSEMTGWYYCNCNAETVAGVAMGLADALIDVLDKDSEGGQ